METSIIIHPDNKEQFNALRSLFKAMKVPFEETNEKKPYNPEFVKKIKEGDNDRKAGKGRKVTLEELNSLWK